MVRNPMESHGRSVKNHDFQRIQADHPLTDPRDESIFTYQHPPRGGGWTLRDCLMAPFTINLAPLGGSRYPWIWLTYCEWWIRIGKSTTVHMGNLRPRFLLVDAPCFTCFAQCINATWQYHGSKSAWYIYWPSRLGLELVGNFVEWLYKSLSLFGKFSHVNSMGLVYLPTWKPWTSSLHVGTIMVKIYCSYGIAIDWFTGVIFLKIAGSELYGSNTIDIDESYTYRVPMNDDSMHWCLEFEHVNLYASIRLPRLPCDFEDSAVLKLLIS